MAETVTMPKLGFDMAEGTLVRWVKAEGESVNKGDILAEIETDKATVEVESSFGGTILRHLVEQGAIVPVGDPIAVIGQPGEKVEGGAPGKAEEAKPAPKGPELTTEASGPRASGEQAVAGSVAQAEIAPAEVQTEAGAPRTSPDQYASKEAAEQSGATITGGAAASDGGPVKASPLARRIAGDNNLDLAGVKGSGPGGRIVRKDVEAALKAPRPAQPAAQPAAAAPAAAPAPAAPKAQGAALPAPTWGAAQPAQDERVPLSKLRGAIGRRMVDSKQNVPHFYVTTQYNVEPLMTLRKQVNEMLDDDQKLSVNDFIVKAVALTLRQFPNLNASLGENEIVRHGQINIGVAVALDTGLLTVVCRDADQKPLRLISAEVKEMVARARTGKVRPDDIEGSTFSISNLGMYDVDHFIAIINPPEAAILAVGSAAQVPVVENGEIKAAWRMQATISADHRVTDGAEAARFMQALKTYLEKPLLLLV